MAKKKYSKKYNNTVNIFWPGGGLDAIGSINMESPLGVAGPKVDAAFSTMGPIKGTKLQPVAVKGPGLNAKFNNFLAGKGISGNQIVDLGNSTEALFSTIANMMDKSKSDTELIDQIGLNNTYAGGGPLGWAQMGTDIATSIVDDVQKSKGRDVSHIIDAIKKGGNIQVASGNYDNIMAQRGMMGEYNHVTKRDLGHKNFGQVLLSSSGEAAQGFAKGFSSTGNVWGGIAQGVVQGFGDALSAVFGNANNKRKARYINRESDRSNIRKDYTFDLALANTKKQQHLNAMSNVVAANGGPLNMKYTGVMSPFGNRFDLGGNMDTTFTNGVTIIGNGGTHEESPFEGVPMGIASDGKPNLVEEGEVIWNNYVFSDRLKVPKEIIQTLGLKGSNLSFADAAKQIQEESKERPNDPISKNGLQANMTKLINIQETVRQEKEGNQFATGGKLGKLYEGDGEYPNFLDFGMFSGYTPLGILDRAFYLGNTPKIRGYNTSNYSPSEVPAASLKTPSRDYNTWKFGDDFPYYSNGRYDTDYINWVNNGLTEKMVKDGLQNYPELFSRYLKSNPNYIPTLTQARKWMTDGNFSDWHKYAAMLYSKYLEDTENAEVDAMLKASKSLGMPFDDTTNDPAKSKKSSDDTTTNDKGNPVAPMRLHPLRHSALAAQFASVLNNMLGGNKPNYSNLASFENAIRNIRDIDSTEIGNKLMYKPFDRDYYQNMLIASSNATRRAARNVSGGNRAQALAGILATDYNEGIKLGELARQAEEYNWARRQKVEDFNRATNMFNSELGFKAGATNAELDAKRATLLGELARQREIERLANRKEHIDANTAFINSLANLGKEKTYLDMLRWMGETNVLRGESKNAYDPEFFDFWNAWQERKKNKKTTKTNG